MRPRRLLGPVALCLLPILAAIGRSADAPPSGTSSLLRGQIQYHAPPEGWELSKESSSDTAAAYIDKKGPGIMALQVLPADAAIDKAAGAALVTQLKADHKKRKDEIVLDPKLEPDKRFALRIHEKYKHKGHLADELHLYRQVGARPCMVTVNAESDKPDEVKPIHGSAEDVLLSAAFVKQPKRN